MNRCIFALSLSALVFAVANCTTYRQLNQSWENYEAPSLARMPADSAAPPATAVEVAAVPSPVDEVAAPSTSVTGRNDVAQRLGVSPAVLEMTAESASDDSEAVALFTKPWSLDTAEAFALLRNLRVRAAEQRLTAAVETIGQVTALDEILKQYSAYTQAQMAGIGPMKGADSIQMKFPFPGVTALKGRVAQDNIRIAGSNRAAVYRDTLGAIQTAYWELMFTHEATTITRETLALLNRLEAVAATRYKSGNTSYQDVAKVQIRRQELAEELVSWKRRRQSQEAQIRALLDLVSDTAIARPKPVSPGRTLPSRPQLIRLALEKRQELVRLRAQLDKMDHMILMAETMIRPTYGPNLSAYENRPVQTVGGGAVKAPFALTTTAQKGAGLPKMPWYGSQDAYLRDHDKAKYFPRSMPRHPARHRVAPPRFCPG